MAVQAGSVTLSASAWQVAWERAQLGDLPIVLYVPFEGFLESERAAVVDRALSELARLGLARQGALTDEFTRMLTVLARARREVNLRMWTGKGGTPGSELRGMAAASGDSGVLASMVDGQLTLRPIYGSGLAREIVGLLPEHRTGPGRSVSVAREVLDPAAAAAGSSLYRLADHLISRGVPGDQARTLPRMIDGTFRRGQLGAAVSDRDGRRTPARTTLAFHDTEGGRYLMEDRRTADGKVWTTVTPASAAMLAEHLQGILDRLQRG